MRKPTLIEQLEELQRQAEAEGGVWCGGIATSIVTICRKVEATRVVYRGRTTKENDMRPHEGRQAIIYRGNERATVTQHWHGGKESGEWWWTLQ